MNPKEIAKLIKKDKKRMCVLPHNEKEDYFWIGNDIWVILQSKEEVENVFLEMRKKYKGTGWYTKDVYTFSDYKFVSTPKEQIEFLSLINEEAGHLYITKRKKLYGMRQDYAMLLKSYPLIFEMNGGRALCGGTSIDSIHIVIAGIQILQDKVGYLKIMDDARKLCNLPPRQMIKE